MQISWKEKRGIILAAGVFLLTALMAIIGNSLLGYGFQPTFSISHYVGLETWSAVIFAAGNFVVAFFMLYYLFLVGEKWGFRKWFFWVIVLMAIGLIGLSMCPIGYYDLEGAGWATSAPSRVHEICSRGMFVMMLIISARFASAQAVSKGTKVASLVFLLYGLFCVYGYLGGAGWFARHILLFESGYLLGFLALCLGLQGKEEQNGANKRI